MTTLAPTYAYVIDYSGQRNGRDVSGSISVDTRPGSPTEAARLIYRDLVDLDLMRRRRDWHVSSFSGTRHALVLFAASDATEAYITFGVRKIRATPDSEYRAYLDELADSIGLHLVGNVGTSYRLIAALPNGRLYGHEIAGDLDRVGLKLTWLAQFSPDALRDEISDWSPMAPERPAPVVPTFPEGTSPQTMDIIAGEMEYCRLPFRVVIWRNVGCPLPAWSTTPDTIFAYANSWLGGTTANRAVYSIAVDGTVTLDVPAAAGLPLYADDPAPVLVSPLFVGGLPVATRFESPVRWEPGSPLGRAWRAYRAGAAINLTSTTKEEETVRRYLTARRRLLTASGAIREARGASGRWPIPYPPRLPHNHLVGPAFAHCDPRPNCRWIEQPVFVGLRLLTTEKRSTGYYVDRECDETLEGVVYRLPHGRIVAGYRQAGETAAVVDLSTVWDLDDVAHARSWGDRLAERAAETQRLESEAWDAGCRAAMLDMQISQTIKRIREIFRTLAKTWDRLKQVDLTKEHRALSRDVCEDLVADVESWRRELRKLEDEWCGSQHFKDGRESY